MIAVAAILALISLMTLRVHPQIAERWGIVAGAFNLVAFLRLTPIPLLGLAGLAVTLWSLRRESHYLPFAGAVMVFLSGYAGLAAAFFPFVVPYALTFRQAASADNALALVLGGLCVLLPAILGYTVLVYWLFRGKVQADAGYH